MEPHNVLRFCCAAKMVIASEAREPNAYRDCSNRLLCGAGGWLPWPDFSSQRKAPDHSRGDRGM